jgi:hypothetical protein
LPNLPAAKKLPRFRLSSFQFSVTRWGVSLGIEGGAKAESIFKKIDLLILRLREADLLTDRRPLEMPHFLERKYEKPFVLEEMEATKLVLPAQSYPDGVEALAIWVSKPPQKDLEARRDEWSFTGCWLYLVEVRWDVTEPYQTVLSGCSALRAVANIYHGRNSLEASPGEPLGRWGEGDALDRLGKLGASFGTQKRIISLYRKRYITNEQILQTSGKRTRVSDLLAYPIFIAGL